ncbi:MAG: hypothetical protein BGO98_34585 [Myxococcales bacterium 68-20]|nr:MAG: hypothetical protein BGO98_34585 [Myxococcales bacterium 68-20]
MASTFLVRVSLVAMPLLVGCNSTVFSPPARPMPLESAATLPMGDTGIQVEGGTHGRIFGPDLLSGTVRVRHGIAEDVDATGEVSAMHVDVHPDVPTSTSTFVHAARGGAKVRLAKPLAIAGGFGGGFSAAGAFVSPEAGPIVAWENRYVVPFLATRFGVSQPISPRAVDTSEQQDGSRIDRPRTTWLATGVAGLRIPIGWSEPEAGTLRGSLLAGAGVTHVADNRDKDTFSQFAVGGELVF